MLESFYLLVGVVFQQRRHLQFGVGINSIFRYFGGCEVIGLAI
jgi:hypothetical protein